VAALVREGDLRGRRVLDVGCGTGRLAAALAEREACRVWAVDPSPEMLAIARARTGPPTQFRLARAEALPFRPGWFERVVMRLVVHLVDRPVALAEARRVLGPGGRLAIATFDPVHFDRYWLNALFPSLEAIDRARFPSPDVLRGELGRAGFAAVYPTALHQRARIDRKTALEKIRGRHISTFDLIEAEEYRTGLERAARELPAEIEYALEWVIVVARC
jgi:ubiquinone/menaquinone biosynthesis C-methylase UbiE